MRHAPFLRTVLTAGVAGFFAEVSEAQRSQPDTLQALRIH